MSYSSFFFLFFFFFQAEDGIRDYKVTGVQTCALPICRNRLPVAPDAMVRHRRVNDIRTLDPRQMTGDAAVILVAFPPQRDRQAAARLLMALEAAFAVIGCLFLCRRQLVGIVAGDAPQLLPDARGRRSAGAKTTAGIHLFHMADRFEVILGRVAQLERIPEEFERQPRAVIERLPVARQDANPGLQMTLLANRLAQPRI